MKCTCKEEFEDEEDSSCDAPATQEDLLCDECRAGCEAFLSLIYRTDNDEIVEEKHRHVRLAEALDLLHRAKDVEAEVRG